MSLDIYAKKFFGGIVALFLALAAYFQASAASQLVGAGLIGSNSAPLPPEARVTTPDVRSQRPDATPIIKRNPFDSTTGPLDAKPVEIPVNTAPALDLSNPLAAPDCEGVEATIITESDDPVWSVAAMKGAGEAKLTMKRVGDQVGDREVAFIGFNRAHASPSVWLANATSLCQVLLFKRAASATPQAAAPSPTPAPPAEPVKEERPRGGAAKIPAEMAAKIQKISDTEFAIERGLVDEVMENQATLMRSARIVPEQKNGETIGIRLFGIRPDTLLGTLGIQNGDRLEEINGFKMGNPEQALQAYAKLRSAEKLTMKVNRRGNPTTLEYNFK
jgi:general secretion pathway protein C